MVGADNISEMDSEFASSQASASSISLPSAPLSDVRLSDVSEVAFSQASASPLSLPSAPLSEASVNDVRLSDVSLSDARLSGVGSNDAGFSDVDLGNDVHTDFPALPDATAKQLLDGSVSAASAPAASGAGATQPAEIKKTAERTAFECLLGEPESSDAVTSPRPRSERKGGGQTEEAASDAAAWTAPDEDAHRKPIYISLIGVEEFKWSGLPDNSIG